MTNAPRFMGFNIVVRDMAASSDFYRQLGLDVVDKHGAGRVCVDAPNQHFDLDTAASAPEWNKGWNGTSIGITFELESRDDVDELVTKLRGAGYEVQQPPFDAPWGRRLGVMADPDGNSVGLMSAS